MFVFIKRQIGNGEEASVATHSLPERSHMTVTHNNVKKNEYDIVFYSSKRISFSGGNKNNSQAESNLFHFSNSIYFITFFSVAFRFAYGFLFRFRFRFLFSFCLLHSCSHTPSRWTEKTKMIFTFNACLTCFAHFLFAFYDYLANNKRAANECQN